MDTTSSDVYSLSDQVLSDKLLFEKEIGFGNWGSVWLCRPKRPKTVHSDEDDQTETLESQKIAVKLVHRSKTKTTAARVRSLWNEMKIVRALNAQDPHPSIIPFHSFIITPSYALITMEYLPTLIPVEVEESIAKEWFRSLLSGIEFIHKRGIVHNDIKPANILLSFQHVPVLVDFGFAEKYDVQSTDAFHSNLSYGTPEYLSPERARGLPHDTRKSDVWSLGITMFEILIGRTPFENSEGEQFTTKDDLEKYWSRTLKGKWVGAYKMSKGLEQLLKRMMSPNADLRYTASEAYADQYWNRSLSSSERSSPTGSLLGVSTGHKRVSSANVNLEGLGSKLVPWTRSSKANGEYPSSVEGEKKDRTGLTSSAASSTVALSRRSSKSDMKPAKLQAKHKLRVRGLSPIKASPPATPRSAIAKENQPTPSSRRVSMIKGGLAAPGAVLGHGLQRPRSPLNPTISSAAKERDLTSPPPPSAGMRHHLITGSAKKNLPSASSSRTSSADSLHHRRHHPHRQSAVGGRGVLMDLTDLNRHVDTVRKEREAKRKEHKDRNGSVRQRVMEWEREKERLREMERLEEMQRERDNVPTETEAETELDSDVEPQSANPTHVQDQGQVLVVPPRSHGLASVSPTESIGTGWACTLDSENIAGTANTANTSVSGLLGIRQSFRQSIGKMSGLVKASNAPQRAPSFETMSFDMIDGERDIASDYDAAADTSLPVVHDARKNEQIAADNNEDRLTMWIKNVEKVVEDARQNYASTSLAATTLPPLPLAPPLMRSTSSNQTKGTNRSSRALPRKLLAANQIFSPDGEQSMMMDTTTFTSFADATAGDTIPADCTGNETFFKSTSNTPKIQVEHVTPKRARRATVSTGDADDVFSSGSPSKKRDARHRSQGDLLQRRITPIDLLEKELSRLEMPVNSPPSRLSAVFDRSLFIAPPKSPVENGTPVHTPNHDTMTFDELTSSPCIVEPYPARKPSADFDAMVLDSPNQRRIEGVYDRFLMATTSVKRVGKGYQSGVIGNGPISSSNNHSKAFYTTRRPMAPPISSEDSRPQRQQPQFVDELGMMTEECGNSPMPAKGEGRHTVAIVRRAFKAIVNPSKTVARRVTPVA